MGAELFRSNELYVVVRGNAGSPRAACFSGGQKYPHRAPTSPGYIPLENPKENPTVTPSL